MGVRGQYAKGLAKRQEILDAALDLFSKNGYDRTSVREVARLTDLSQAGLLHYFSNKEELFTEVLRQRDERNGMYYGDHPDSPLNVEGLLAIVMHNVDEPGLLSLYVALSAESSTAVDSPARSFFEQRYQVLRRGLAENVRAKQEEGELVADLDPDVVATLLVAAADGLQVQWLLDPDGVDMGSLLDQFWQALHRVH